MDSDNNTAKCTLNGRDAVADEDSWATKNMHEPLLAATGWVLVVLMRSFELPEFRRPHTSIRHPFPRRIYGREVVRCEYILCIHTRWHVHSAGANFRSRVVEFHLRWINLFFFCSVPFNVVCVWCEDACEATTWVLPIFFLSPSLLFADLSSACAAHVYATNIYCYEYAPCNAIKWLLVRSCTVESD